MGLDSRWSRRARRTHRRRLLVVAQALAPNGTIAPATRRPRPGSQRSAGRLEPPIRAPVLSWRSTLLDRTGRATQ
jgi:hypothetical protein